MPGKEANMTGLDVALSPTTHGEEEAEGLVCFYQIIFLVRHWLLLREAI